MPLVPALGGMRKNYFPCCLVKIKGDKLFFEQDVFIKKPDIITGDYIFSIPVILFPSKLIK